ARVSALYEASRGWCAGLILLLETPVHGEAPDAMPDADALQGVFGYFASQLFDRLPESDRDALLRLSFFPRITISEARKVTGNLHVARLLESLYRRHLFTDRRDNTYPDKTGKSSHVHTYQFHALFQAFLKQQVESLGPEQVAS